MERLNFSQGSTGDLTVVAGDSTTGTVGTVRGVAESCSSAANAE